MNEMANALVSLKSFFLGFNGFNGPVFHTPATFSLGYTIDLIINVSLMYPFINLFQIFVQIISNLYSPKPSYLSMSVYFLTPKSLLSHCDFQCFDLTFSLYVTSVMSSVLFLSSSHYMVNHCNQSLVNTLNLVSLLPSSCLLNAKYCKILNLAKSKLVPT